MGPPLRALLAAQLPSGTPFTFYHYSTPPSKSPALFAAPPHAASERTYCESHTLAASVTTTRPDSNDDNNNSNNSNNHPPELLVLAIEVLVYSTARLTTIFVSKADSTGCLADLDLPRSNNASPLQAICGTFVSWLARERQRDGKKLVVSLFARAQDQYLFPASIENKNKHVLDDRGLVKWWCRVLDPLVWEYKAEDDKTPFHDRLLDGHSTIPHTETTAKGYLVIPGYESYDTLRYVPPSPVPNTPRRWAATHPLLQIAPHPAAPPRCLVPHFPDDPKARFLDELDEELPDRGTDAMVADGGTPSRSDGKWKSVKTLDQFWEFMAFRQECSSGRIVGFIWVVLTPPRPSIPEEDEEPSSQQSLSQASQVSQIDSQESVPTPRKRNSKLKNKRRKAKTQSGPIPLILPRIKTSSSNLSTSSNASTGSTSKVPPETSRYFIWPASSRGTICLSSKDYNRAHEIMLHLSFANSAAVARSTKKFKEEIAVLGGVKTWGWTVVGTKEATAAPVASASNGAGAVTVIGVRKKRKADADAPAESAPVESAQPAPAVPAAATINTLGVRKKPKN